MTSKAIKTLMTKAGVAAAVFLSASAFVSSAIAEPMLVTDSSSLVTGVTGLEVGDMIFDVEFSSGGLSYNEALANLGITSFFDFGTFAAAETAGFALAVFFNSQAPDAEGEDMSWGNIDNSGHTDFLVSYESTGSLASIAKFVWGATLFTAWNTTTAEDLQGVPRGAFLGPDFAYASFTEVTVPEPGAVLLLSTGLLGLAALRRRKQVRDSKNLDIG